MRRVLLLLLIFLSPSFAQSPPHVIQGFIYYNNEPVDGAEITIINLENGEKVVTESQKGAYIIAVPAELWQNGDKAKIIVEYKNMHVEEEFIIDWSKTPQWINVSMGNKKPIADFTYTPQQPTDLDTITFADASNDPDGSIVSWLWEFGDGNTSTEQNPTHRYADNGTYVVKLTVTDDKGATSYTTKIIEVANAPPTVAITYEPEKPEVKKEIKFNAIATDDDGYIVNYTWNFGDGNISYGKNVTHVYAKEGNYTVTLTVKDNDGDVTVKKVEIIIGKKETPAFNVVALLIIFLAIVLLRRNR